MKEIIILGGGFAGVFAAKELLKLPREQFRVTLVDKNSYHLFIPSLYEVATAEEPRSNICIPYSEIFPHGVRIVEGEVLKIDKDNQKVKLNPSASSGQAVLKYDYLVIALGAETQYYDIEGIKEYSTAFKSLEEACEIRDEIREKYQEKSSVGQALMVAVVGGGTTGVELSTELSKFEERLGGNIEVSIFQGEPTLLKGVSHKVSEIAKERLQKAGVNVHLNSRVIKVTKEFLEIEDGRLHPYDVLIWTGGVKSNSIIEKSGLPLNRENRLDVDEYLRVKEFKNVFAAGDIAGITSRVAQVAHEQGSIAGKNLARKIKGEKLIAYKYRLLGFLIPLFGRYVVVDIHGLVFSGILGFIFQQLVFLRYLLMILPPWKAFKRWNRFEGYLAKRM